MTDQQWPPPAPPQYAPPAPSPYGARSSSGPPATIWAAAVTTWVISGLTILLTFVMLAFAAFVGSVIAESFTRSDQVTIGAVVLGIAAVFLLANIAACYLAYEVVRRRQWARIALAGWSGLVGLLGVASLSPPGFLGTAGSIAVVVLLFLPESNAWFDRHQDD